MTESDNVFIAILIILLLIIGGVSFYKIMMNLDDIMASVNFCNSKGYDSSTLTGTYSKMYGKVTCASCYNTQCTVQEFNVTRDLFGLHEIESGVKP